MRQNLMSLRENRDNNMDIFLWELIKKDRLLASKILTFIANEWKLWYLKISNNPSLLFSDQDLGNNNVIDFIKELKKINYY
jgi:hypothetical protein